MGVGCVYQLQPKLILGEVLLHELKLSFTLVEIGSRAKGVFEIIIVLYLEYVILYQDVCNLRPASCRQGRP